MKKIDIYREIAKKNEEKEMRLFQIDDFVNTYQTDLKISNYEELIRDYIDEELTKRICKIVDIIEVEEKQFENFSFSFKHKGGSISDDNNSNDTFFDLVTLVICKGKEKYYFLDAQGQKNPRHIYMPFDWKTIFVEEYIDELWKKYIEENKIEPVLVCCTIQYLDTNETSEITIKMAEDDKESEDNIFFYCTSLNDLKSLTQRGINDFIITEIQKFS